MENNEYKMFMILAGVIFVGFVAIINYFYKNKSAFHIAELKNSPEILNDFRSYLAADQTYRLFKCGGFAKTNSKKDTRFFETYAPGKTFQYENQTFEIIAIEKYFDLDFNSDITKHTPVNAVSSGGSLNAKYVILAKIV